MKQNIFNFQLDLPSDGDSALVVSVDDCDSVPDSKPFNDNLNLVEIIISGTTERVDNNTTFTVRSIVSSLFRNSNFVATVLVQNTFE